MKRINVSTVRDPEREEHRVDAVGHTIRSRREGSEWWSGRMTYPPSVLWPNGPMRGRRTSPDVFAEYTQSLKFGVTK